MIWSDSRWHCKASTCFFAEKSSTQLKISIVVCALHPSVLFKFNTTLLRCLPMEHHRTELFSRKIITKLSSSSSPPLSVVRWMFFFLLSSSSSSRYVFCFDSPQPLSIPTTFNSNCFNDQTHSRAEWVRARGGRARKKLIFRLDLTSHGGKKSVFFLSMNFWTSRLLGCCFSFAASVGRWNCVEIILITDTRRNIAKKKGLQLKMCKWDVVSGLKLESVWGDDETMMTTMFVETFSSLLFASTTPTFAESPRAMFFLTARFIFSAQGNNGDDNKI